MELTRITKLLLWLLSKRPDVGTLNVRELEPMDCLQDLNDIAFGDLTPEEQHLLQADFLNDCFLKPLD